MKPIGSAQGKGIFLFSKLSEISEWKTDFKGLKAANFMTGKRNKKSLYFTIFSYMNIDSLI